MHRSDPTQRLFFAMWPSESQRLMLLHASQAVLSQCDGRVVPAANLHVTLAFLGSVLERRIPELLHLGQLVAERSPPLQLELSRIAYWRESQVLCVRGSVSHDAARMVEQLQERLVASDFAPDGKPFRPHVTLARKALHPATAASIAPVRWDFADFALVGSRTASQGALYTVLQSFPLQGERSVQ